MTVTSACRRAAGRSVRERVREALRRLGPVARGESVLVGVSGGPDSLALLHLLADLAQETGFAVHAAHFDHGLRGERSAAEARAVADLTARLGIPCTVETARPGAIEPRGRGLQAAARSARYAFFERLADAVGARWIATAHTADDQAETVLMRLVRGAGPGGVAGIPAVRGRIIRPLLGVSRPEIEAYLAASGLIPFQDPSNHDPRFVRARVRHDVLPLLRGLNPRATETIARTAGLLAEDAAYLDAAARDALDQARVAAGDGWVELASQAVADLAPTIRRRVIRLALADLGAPVDRLSSERLDAASRACGQRTAGRITLGQGLLAEYAATALRLGRESSPCHAPPTELHGEGVHRLAGWGIVVHLQFLAAWNGEPPLGRWDAVFDSESLPGMLGVRRWRPGDRLFPEGMRGRKRVQDLFVDEKIPRWRRAAVPLLTAGNDVVWVMGLRRDRRYLPRRGAPAIKVHVQGPGGPVDVNHHVPRTGQKGVGS